MEIQKISYAYVNAIIGSLANKIKARNQIELNGIKGVYGVPRGGVPVAILLAHQLNLPVVDCPDETTLVVDDITDSGKTLSTFKNNHTVTLFISKTCKKRPTFYGEVATGWVEFPWETGELPAADNVVRMIEAIGEDPSREGLLDTPKRVVKSWKDLYAGYDKDPKQVLGTTFDAEGYDQMVVLRDIEMYSTCEHHMLPFFGKAHIAYIPNKRVVGLSKLARLLECYSRRLQIQERLTQQIGNAIQEVLKPRGVAVVIEAKHFCMVARGIGKQNSVMTTSHLLGDFYKDQKCRDEFMTLIGKN